jgi:hypothetical protein
MLFRRGSPDCSGRIGIDYHNRGIVLNYDKLLPWTAAVATVQSHFKSMQDA